MSSFRLADAHSELANCGMLGWTALKCDRAANPRLVMQSVEKSPSRPITYGAEPKRLECSLLHDLVAAE